ncbi:MAG: hypothetical protein H8E55_73375 [Pelagibacterales bacterium]|nr:hypothetical protein [Pelagibacterales bacterium]
MRKTKSNIGFPVTLSMIKVFALFVGATTTSINLLSIIKDVKIGGAGKSEFQISWVVS